MSKSKERAYRSPFGEARPIKTTARLFREASLAILSIALLQSCALSGGDSNGGALKQGSAFSFVPVEYVISEDRTQFVLIDVITLQGSRLTIAKNTKPVGQVEYFGQYPTYSETPCQGKGYTETFEERSKIATSRLKLRFFVNGEEIVDEKVVSPEMKVDVAVYAEYAPLSEFTETGAVPVEYTKSYLHSGSCRLMCPSMALSSIRPILGEKKYLFHGGCNYWRAMGQVGNTFPGELTDLIEFRPDFLSEELGRNQIMPNYEKCGVVESNEDLATLYDRAASEDCNHTNVPFSQGKWARTIIKEIRIVGHKVKFTKPFYSITNFSRIVQGLSSENDNGLKRQPVFTRAEFGR